MALGEGESGLTTELERLRGERTSVLRRGVAERGLEERLAAARLVLFGPRSPRMSKRS